MIEFASLVRMMEGVAAGFAILLVVSALMSRSPSRKPKSYVQTLAHRGTTSPPVLAGLSAITKPADLLNLAQFAEGRPSPNESSCTQGESSGSSTAQVSSQRG